LLDLPAVLATAVFCGRGGCDVVDGLEAIDGSCGWGIGGGVVLCRAVWQGWGWGYVSIMTWSPGRLEGREGGTSEHGLWRETTGIPWFRVLTLRFSLSFVLLLFAKAAPKKKDHFLCWESFAAGIDSFV